MKIARGVKEEDNNTSIFDMCLVCQTLDGSHCTIPVVEEVIDFFEHVVLESHRILLRGKYIFGEGRHFLSVQTSDKIYMFYKDRRCKVTQKLFLAEIVKIVNASKIKRFLCENQSTKT